MKENEEKYITVSLKTTFLLILIIIYIIYIVVLILFRFESRILLILTLSTLIILIFIDITSWISEKIGKIVEEGERIKSEEDEYKRTIIMSKMLNTIYDVRRNISELIEEQ
jgi:hypothetical protein